MLYHHAFCAILISSFFHLQRVVFAVCGTRAVHEFNHGMAPFGGYRPFHVNPQYYSSPHSKTYYHSADPYPGGFGLPTVTHPPEMQESCSPHGTLGRPLHGL